MKLPLSLRAAGLLLTALALTACQDEPVQRYQSFVFGTLVEVKVRAPDRAVADTATNQLFAEFDSLHTSWHAWKPGPMAEVNHQLGSGNWFKVPSSIVPILEKSRQLFQSSNGLFNPAMGELIALWGFHADDLPTAPPQSTDIEKLIADLPDMDDIELDGMRAKGRHPHLKIDAGGMAKGHAVDLGIELLQKHGIENALINAGGDLCGIGDRGDRPWRIGIRQPDQPGVLASISLVDGDCVFTSGDYERGYEYEGKHYHHIIDPRSGYPADQAISVTVIHRNGALADAASTALLIAGPDAWQNIARQMDIHHVLMVDRHGRLHMTPSMHSRIRLENDQAREMIITPLSQ